MSTKLVRIFSVLLALMLVAAACSADDSSGGDDGGGAEDETGLSDDEGIDYEAIGLWDDGPCDEAMPPLKLGLMTVFESPVLSLEDQATALEAAAEAFNARGGANGACIEVTTCDDGGNADQAVGCVRTIDDAGVVATVNDQGTAGQADVSAAMAEAGIPRVASNVVSEDWGDQNAYPLDASGTGVTFLLPQALVEADVTDIGLIRVDLAAASALVGLLTDLYADEGVTFPYDVPVPAGTTDFSQFILGAQDEGVGGVSLALGEQEAVQVVRAGQQLGTDLLIGSSLGTFSHASIAELGDFADQMVFLWSFAPATYDIPVYQALRADLAASGEEALQPLELKASPMRSWIGLYALLYMIRDAGMTDFTREGITEMLESAQDVPMLDIYGGEDWTPDADHPGLFARAGIDRWSTWSWDAEAEGDGFTGNFEPGAEISFDDVLCGSPFGAEGPC
jgi:ABC-type branched-subunit amino acid transport system substrate-binding protein